MLAPNSMLKPREGECMVNLFPMTYWISQEGGEEVERRRKRTAIIL